MGYKHITINERESIMLGLTKGLPLSQIANQLQRNKSTISREIRRNSTLGNYTANNAQKLYEDKRKNCKMQKKLSNIKLKDYIADKFLNLKWSPEEIVGRVSKENKFFPISINTIYRSINNGEFDKYVRIDGGLKATRKLRHKGKKRHKNGEKDKRGTFIIDNSIDERPKEAEDRSEIGHWEADTVLGKKDGICFVTLTDRKSRFLICATAKSKSAEEVNNVIYDVLKDEPCLSITPDRGKEFSWHRKLSKKLKVKFYFPLPHQPWRRGTNENTNGLIREYFPKGVDLANFTKEFIDSKIRELNFRPRKCLGWLTPYEVY